MLSSSFERQARNDEGTVCNQLAQYRSMRIPRGFDVPIRKRRGVETKTNFLGDVEIINQKRQKKSGRLMMEGEEDLEGAVAAAEDGGEEVIDEPLIPADGEKETQDEFDARQVDVVEVSTALSQCPVENGVVRTMWGAVAAGTVISGIAAGLQPQSVSTRDLLALSSTYRQDSARQTQAVNVDNRWAATLAGDLAEVALLQGPVTAQVQVGGIGGWNSTTIPRWYFLSQRDRLEMTDAEIRGGLDGLILAMNVDSYRSRVSQLRLSQLIDMYYSQRGVFSSNVASCNRRTLFTTVAPVAQMQAQATAFSAVLDLELQLRVTLPPDAIARFSNAAVAALSTYVRKLNI